MNNDSEAIAAHYVSAWSNQPAVKRWKQGPISDLPQSFCVLEFRPTPTRQMWTYATCGMSQPWDPRRLELHLFSPICHDANVELLTAAAHYHRTGEMLGLGHTVNFGRPWFEGSECCFGLISLPYLDGPTLEEICPLGGATIRFLWLIPITKAERDFKKMHGLDALQQRFDDSNFNYVDPNRTSVV